MGGTGRAYHLAAKGQAGRREACNGRLYGDKIREQVPHHLLNCGADRRVSAVAIDTPGEIKGPSRVNCGPARSDVDRHIAVIHSGTTTERVGRVREQRDAGRGRRVVIQVIHLPAEQSSDV